MSEMLTIPEAAKELKISKSSMLRLVTGTTVGRSPLACIRLGRRILIRRETLTKYLLEAEGVETKL